MKLADAVAVALDGDGNGAGLREALGLVGEELGADRVSAFAFGDTGRTFRVAESAGAALLATGTAGPVEISTQMRAAAGGEVYVSGAFDADPSFSHPGDQLVTELGFRSGIAVPLLIGNQPMGALALTSRSTGFDAARAVDAVSEVSPAITLALHAADPVVPRHVLVCHADSLLAEGIARVLERTLASEAEICTAPADALAHAENAAARIDVVVCDSFFAEGRVHSFLRDLRSIGMTAPALVIGSHDLPLSHHLATRSGAAGYVRRSEGTAALVAAVRHLSAGRTVGLAEDQGSADRDEEPIEHLTPRESSLLLLLERGLRFKQIALQMDISESTAKGYARNVFAKLGVHSRSEAVYEARRQGVLELLTGGARTAPVQPPDPGA